MICCSWSWSLASADGGAGEPAQVGQFADPADAMPGGNPRSSWPAAAGPEMSGEPVLEGDEIPVDRDQPSVPDEQSRRRVAVRREDWC